MPNLEVVGFRWLTPDWFKFAQLKPRGSWHLRRELNFANGDEVEVRLQPSRRRAEMPYRLYASSGYRSHEDVRRWQTRTTRLF